MAEPALSIEEVSNPHDIARACAQDERHRRNSDWLQTRWADVLPQARGKFLAVAEQEAFIPTLHPQEPTRPLHKAGASLQRLGARASSPLLKQARRLRSQGRDNARDIRHASDRRGPGRADRRTLRIAVKLENRHH